MTRRIVGAQPVSDRDWVFGSRPRRLLLEGVLRRTTPADGWNKTQLAEMAGVSANGGVDEHVAGLVAIGLLVPSGRRLALVSPRPALAGALGRVVRELRHVPDSRSRSLAGPPAPSIAAAAGGGSEADAQAVARRELRRALSAVQRAPALSDATRRRAVEILEEALGELNRQPGT